ncbi:MAG: glycosyltransferase [Helicobacter sp.]|nr:glycosyltransferase [Helicobacter sp.]
MKDTSFSIISVVYNDISVLQTIQSALDQDYNNVELIIIDAKSTDGTAKAILDFLTQNTKIINTTEQNNEICIKALANNHGNKTIIFQSRPDSGIYHGMNRGLKLASSDFCMFINAGDLLFSNTVLSELNICLDLECDITICGLMVHYLKQDVKVARFPTHDLSRLYRLFADFGHPNCIFKTKTHKQFLYSKKYALNADYDLIYKMVQNGVKINFLDRINAIFKTGGASDKKALQSLNEALQIAFIYNQKLSMRLKILGFYIFALAKKAIKLIAPKKLFVLLLKFR